ncbi:hypothetical protein [Streptomyces sp. 184]|uniref:hypothetical protein n=1 Tax=Streptomyces sp. 184 TaxID=1827526 RepID=UPI0038922E61
MSTALALLAAGIVGAAGAHYIRHAAHHLRRAGRLIDDIRRETAAAAIDDDGRTRLADAIRTTPAEPTPADHTPAGDDDWTRAMHRRIRRTAKRRNTGPRRRLP